MTAPLPMLAGVADLAVWPGVVIDDTETPSAEAVLAATSAIIRSESGDDNRWPDGATIPAAIKTVAVQVAARVWRNPDAATMRVDGPYTDQFHRAVDDALYLTPNERAIIGRSIVRPKLWTMPFTRDGDEFTGYDCFSGETVPPSPYPAPGSLLYGLL